MWVHEILEVIEKIKCLLILEIHCVLMVNINTLATFDGSVYYLVILLISVLIFFRFMLILQVLCLAHGHGSS
jgi:hypothetical protein